MDDKEQDELARMIHEALVPMTDEIVLDEKALRRITEKLADRQKQWKP